MIIYCVFLLCFDKPMMFDERDGNRAQKSYRIYCYKFVKHVFHNKLLVILLFFIFDFVALSSAGRRKCQLYKSFRNYDENSAKRKVTKRSLTLLLFSCSLRSSH